MAELTSSPVDKRSRVLSCSFCTCCKDNKFERILAFKKLSKTTKKETAGKAVSFFFITQVIVSDDSPPVSHLRNGKSVSEAQLSLSKLCQ